VIAKNPGHDYVAMAEYSIVLSPSYQVPVLYFTSAGSTSSVAFTIDDVYSLLVEPSRRAEIESIGVMGAISYAVCPLPVSMLDVTS
jgi:ubiquitin-like-conjugating enzyme ATG10